MTEQRTDRRHDVHTPTEEHVDDYSVPEKPDKRFSRRLMIGAGTLAAVSSIAGAVVFGGLKSGHSAGEAPAHANRPTASAPAVPGNGEHSPTATATSAETTGNYTADTLPMVTPDGKTVTGVQAYEQALAVPYDESKVTGPDANVKQYGESVVTSVLSGIVNSAKQSYDSRYGEPGAGTYVSSNAYQQAALGPELIDPAYSGEVKDFYNQLSLPGLSGNSVTNFVVHPHFAMSGQNELTGQGTAIVTANRIDVTTAQGTSEYFVQTTVADETTPTGHNWVIVGFQVDSAEAAAQSPLYDPSMTSGN